MIVYLICYFSMWKGIQMSGKVRSLYIFSPSWLCFVRKWRQSLKKYKEVFAGRMVHSTVSILRSRHFVHSWSYATWLATRNRILPQTKHWKTQGTITTFLRHSSEYFERIAILHEQSSPQSSLVKFRMYWSVADPIRLAGRGHPSLLFSRPWIWSSDGILLI